MKGLHTHTHTHIHTHTHTHTQTYIHTHIHTQTATIAWGTYSLSSHFDFGIATDYRLPIHRRTLYVHGTIPVSNMLLLLRNCQIN
jgi:hypothetical protein